MKATTQQVVEALGRHGPVSVERHLTDKGGVEWGSLIERRNSMPLHGSEPPHGSLGTPRRRSVRAPAQGRHGEPPPESPEAGVVGLSSL